MCGIVGIYARKGTPPHREIWPQLVNHLAHRGPDEGGYWAGERFFLGHRRLSIIGLKSGQQPMATTDGTLVVSYNGEIYNYPELRRTLQSRGYVFRTDSDTEVLLHGYRAWGSELPRKLTGMFAFAIADRNAQTLFLARDRFGEKPLLYLDRKDYFAFASEMRPLAALPDQAQALDREALAGYLMLNYVPGDRTLMADIRRLPPASWRLIAPGGDQQERYWSPEDETVETPASLDDALAAFTAHFDEAVRLTLLSDVPVGILLSGGIDSSLVAESAVRQGCLNHAYILDFAEASHSEYSAAQTVAEQLGIPLQRVVLEPTMRFEDLVEHADDPLADSSALPVHTVTQLASQGNKVVLGGDGGDELFAGYLTYKATRLHTQTLAQLPMPVRRFLARQATRIPTRETKVSFSYKLWRFLRAADLPPGEAHFTWNGAWLPADAAGLLAGAEDRMLARAAASSLRQAHALPAYPCLGQLQACDAQEYLTNDILAKMDRMSMANSLETRAPFLNHHLAAWALRLPPEWKLARGGKLKHILRVQAARVFGDALAQRPKQGFSIPVHTWLRGPLKEQVMDLLAPDSLRQLDALAPDAVTRILNQHMRGTRSYGFEIWGLAMFAAWSRRRLLARPAPPPDLPLHQLHLDELDHA